MQKTAVKTAYKRHQEIDYSGKVGQEPKRKDNLLIIVFPVFAFLLLIFLLFISSL